MLVWTVFRVSLFSDLDIERIWFSLIKGELLKRENNVKKE